MALFTAYAKCNDKEEEFQFWSKAQANSIKNTIDACDTYYKAHEGYKGKIQIMRVRKTPYKELELKHGNQSCIDSEGYVPESNAIIV